MIYLPEDIKMCYVVVGDFDNDEVIEQKVLVSSPIKVVAKNLAQKASTIFWDIKKINKKREDYLARWKDANKPPTFKPRVGRLSPDQQKTIAKEKVIWAEWKSRYDAIVKAYDEDITNKLILDEEGKMLSSLMFDYTDSIWEGTFDVQEVPAIEK